MTPSSDPSDEDIRLRPMSGELVDPTGEAAFRRDLVHGHLHLYGQAALLIAIGFSAFSLLDLASLGWSAAFLALLVGRLSVSAAVLATRRRMLRQPDEFAVDAGLDRIALNQLALYAVVLVACGLRPQDAATNAVSVAVMVLAAMVVVPGRFATQAVIGGATMGGLVAIAVTRFDGAVPVLPLAANLTVALGWGLMILRMTNRDARRRWMAAREREEANDRLSHELQVADDLRAELQTLARQDPLTGAANRRELHRVAAGLLREDDRREAAPLSLLLLDADRFKALNDRFGHATGDEALRTIVEAVRGVVRDEDLVARVGGEEFAVLLPRLGPADARRAAERIRIAVATSPIDGTDGRVVTVSVGVASRREGDRLETLMSRADEAMYRVKRDGGDAVGVAQLAPEPVPNVAG